MLRSASCSIKSFGRSARSVPLCCRPVARCTPSSSPDGRLFGIGAGGLEGTAHAIVGGTGRFTGAAGSYSIEPASRLPGRSVSFAFTLTGLEA